MSAARAAAEGAKKAATPEEVSAVLRAAVAPFLDPRLIDPNSPLPGRGSGGYFEEPTR
jgi:hypothetical protein